MRLAFSEGYPLQPRDMQEVGEKLRGHGRPKLVARPRNPFDAYQFGGLGLCDSTRTRSKLICMRLARSKSL